MNPSPLGYFYGEVETPAVNRRSGGQLRGSGKRPFFLMLNEIFTPTLSGWAATGGASGTVAPPQAAETARLGISLVAHLHPMMVQVSTDRRSPDRLQKRSQLCGQRTDYKRKALEREGNASVLGVNR